MRRCLPCFASAAVMLVLAGCLLRSVHPLVPDQEGIVDPALFGTWAEQESEDTWTFEPLGDRSYRLLYFQHSVQRVVQGNVTHTVEERGDTAIFHVHLGQIGTHRFLDLFPVEATSGFRAIKNEFYNLHLLPTHTFLRIRMERDKAYLASFSPERLQELIAAGQVSLKHEAIGDDILLTAGTDDLKAFFVSHSTDPKGFGKETELRRITK